MSFVAVAVGVSAKMGGDYLGGSMAANSEKKRAINITNAMERSGQYIDSATRDANKTALDMNERARGDLAPFRGYGVQAGDTLASMLFGGRNVDDVLKESSLFKFQSEQGSRNINRELSARGLYGSGAGLETLARFNNQLVAEEGQRFTERLSDMTQLGQGAATSMAAGTNNTGQFMGGNIFNAGMNKANMYLDASMGAAGANARAGQIMGSTYGGMMNTAGDTALGFGKMEMFKSMLDFGMT